MSIRYVHAKELDTDKWDQALDKDPGALLYAYSWFLDMTGDDWDALVLNDYEAVLPLVYRKKYGLSYIFRPTGIQQLGLAGERAESPTLLAEFLQAIPKKYKLIDIFTNAHNSVSSLEGKWQKTKRTNLLLDLDRSYEEIYRGYFSNTRRNLKKAGKHNFQIFEHDPPEVLITLFKENQGPKFITPDDFYPKMLHIMHVLIHKRLGKLWTLHDERNSPIAGIFVVEFKNRAVLLFTGSDSLGRETQAITYLINEYLMYGSQRFEYFDFEGSDTEGVKKFYESFGSFESNYYHLRKNSLPYPFRWFK